jgi:hypothetical protein
MIEQLHREEIAYLAGLFDGEGSVAIYEGTVHGFSYHATITSTNRNVLEWVQARLGGSIFDEKRTEKKNKTCYKWQISGDTACEFFHAIHEFSLIKKRELEIAMFYGSLPKSPGVPYTKQQREERRLLVELLKVEKRR